MRVIPSIEIIEHELIPKHDILSAKEKEEVLEVHEVTINQLPKLLVSDPIAEMIGAKAGDIVRITRESETAGEAIYYRAVVKK